MGPSLQGTQKSSRRKLTHMGGVLACSFLGARYGFGLLRRSQGFPGDFIRAALLLQKLLSGKPLTVVALGGSVTAAGHLPDGMRLGKGTYGERIVEALNDAFPPRQQGSRHELLRTFLAGAGSFAHHFCAFDYFRALWPERDDWWRLRQADVFVVECAANDWALLQDNMTLPPVGRVYEHSEALVRQLLALPSRPLVVFLHFGVWGADVAQSSYLRSAERLLNVVASYYSVPSVSMWRAFHPLFAGGPHPDPVSDPDSGPGSPLGPLLSNGSGGSSNSRAKGGEGGGSSQSGGDPSGPFVFEELFSDKVHPTAAGHAIAGDLVLYYLLNQFDEILQRGLQYEEVGQGGGSFPAPTAPQLSKGPREVSLGSEGSREGSLEDAGAVGALLTSDVGSSANVNESDLAVDYCPTESLCGSCKGSIGLGLGLTRGGLSALQSAHDQFLSTPSNAPSQINNSSTIGELGDAGVVDEEAAWKLPRPMQSRAQPEPLCVLAQEWNVTSIGRQVFPAGVPKERSEYAANSSAWWLQPCGPLVPQLKCWMAKQAAQPIAASIYLGRRKPQRLGILYKIHYYKDEGKAGAGARVLVNGRVASDLDVLIENNLMTHWWLNDSLSELTSYESDRLNVTIIPRTAYFNIIAIVAD